MNENEFEYDGKTLIAVESKSCNKCALFDIECYSCGIPCCSRAFRKDGRTVIFVLKEDQQ